MKARQQSCEEAVLEGAAPDGDLLEPQCVFTTENFEGSSMGKKLAA